MSNPVYNIKNYNGLKLLPRLRLGLSHLNAHRFNHNFQNCINPLWAMSTKMKNNLFCRNKTGRCAWAFENFLYDQNVWLRIFFCFVFLHKKGSFPTKTAVRRSHTLANKCQTQYNEWKQCCNQAPIITY